MSVRTSLLAVIDNVRDILGPSGLDLTTSQLTVRTRTWAGGLVGSGSYTDADLVLPQKYKISEVDSREVPESVGRYGEQLIRVKVTPPGDGGTGYSLAQIAPTPTSEGVQILYVVTGALAGNYARVDVRADRPFRYELLLARMRDTP